MQVDLIEVSQMQSNVFMAVSNEHINQGDAFIVFIDLEKLEDVKQAEKHLKDIRRLKEGRSGIEKKMATPVLFVGVGVKSWECYHQDCQYPKGLYENRLDLDRCSNCGAKK